MSYYGPPISDWEFMNGKKLNGQNPQLRMQESYEVITISNDMIDESYLLIIVMKH